MRTNRSEGEGGNLLFRILDLQLKAEKGTLSDEERAELARLETEWSNRCLSPSEHPVKLI